MAGRLRTVSDGLGTVTNFYDNLNRLTTVSNAFGRVLGLGYDLEDNVTTRTNANGVVLLSTYDQLHRLLSQTWPDTGIERFLYTPRGLVARTNQLGKVTRIEYDPPGLSIAQPLRKRKRAAPRLMTAALSQAVRTRKVRVIPRFYAMLCPA